MKKLMGIAEELNPFGKKWNGKSLRGGSKGFDKNQKAIKCDFYEARSIKDQFSS